MPIANEHESPTLKEMEIVIQFDKIFMEHVEMLCPETCTVKELCRLAHQGIDAGEAHAALQAALKNNRERREERDRADSE